MKKPVLTLREITLFAILGALTFGAKWVMSPLPNIEPATLMVLLFGAVFGWKGIFPTAVYVGAEFLFFGLGLWNIMYLYIWLVPLFLGLWLKKMNHPLGWAMASGTFGLLFGLLCAPVYAVTGGLGYAIATWVSGIGFDLLHCAGNFVMALLLFAPLRKLTERLNKSLPMGEGGTAAGGDG